MLIWDCHATFQIKIASFQNMFDKFEQPTNFRRTPLREKIKEKNGSMIKTKSCVLAWNLLWLFHDEYCVKRVQWLRL